jgi:hypothetical protein
MDQQNILSHLQDLPTTQDAPQKDVLRTVRKNPSLYGADSMTAHLSSRKNLRGFAVSRVVNCFAALPHHNIPSTLQLVVNHTGLLSGS